MPPAQIGASHGNTEEKIQRYDNFCYLWAALREALELFEGGGELPELSWRQQEAEFYYNYAAGLLPTAAAEIRMAVVTALDEEVRSSSLIENVNSR